MVGNVGRVELNDTLRYFAYSRGLHNVIEAASGLVMTCRVSSPTVQEMNPVILL
jgi:hypothetical protein